MFRRYCSPSNQPHHIPLQRSRTLPFPTIPLPRPDHPATIPPAPPSTHQSSGRLSPHPNFTTSLVAPHPRINKSAPNLFQPNPIQKQPRPRAKIKKRSKTPASRASRHLASGPFFSTSTCTAPQHQDPSWHFSSCELHVPSDQI
ncbi:hypothetical protein K458DRAFT_191654 [Lentithecium fluviatile CBS 122367]|uniref:Uncharacterized protein n=1 Tax=Lentithecium fluviatile CBS 122367 TaxID=1168545 RepID=A0A6G1JBI4_9PLEO|nr:hypothetical protein K458DRAFT_191654 [Lentithecium fluviatile CBS 122367]